jgi:hypothetical protein
MGTHIQAKPRLLVLDTCVHIRMYCMYTYGFIHQVCMYTYLYIPIHMGTHIQAKARLLVLDTLLSTTLSNLEFQEEYLF